MKFKPQRDADGETKGPLFALQQFVTVAASKIK